MGNTPDTEGTSGTPPELQPSRVPISCFQPAVCNELCEGGRLRGNITNLEMAVRGKAIRVLACAIRNSDPECVLVENLSRTINTTL